MGKICPKTAHLVTHNFLVCPSANQTIFKEIRPFVAIFLPILLLQGVFQEIILARVLIIRIMCIFVSLF